MEAVVLTVKASYVASRMFNNHKQVLVTYLKITIMSIVITIDTGKESRSDMSAITSGRLEDENT